MASQENPLVEKARHAASLVLAGMRAAWRVIVTVWGEVWPVLRLVLRRALEVLFALILLFEEWGWRPLAELLARLARYPWIARVERHIAGLPPYGALAAFTAPSVLILPLKLVALYLIASGHALSAALLFIGAKIAGTAILARLFMLTQPKLMQIGWFARTYNLLMPWKDRMFVAIRASRTWRYGRIVKYRVGQAVKARWVEWRPTLVALGLRMTEEARNLMVRLRRRIGG